MSVYFYYGDEDYLIDLELKKYRAELDPNFVAMNYVEYTFSERAKNGCITYPELIPILRTQAMMFGKMMIVINCTKLFSATLGDKQIKEITDALDNNTGAVDIFLVAKLDRDKSLKLDARKKLFKHCKGFNSQEFKCIPAWEESNLVNWIQKFAKERNLKISDNLAKVLVENIGNNLRQYIVELEKLELMAYPEKTVTREMINEICISNEDLFHFTDFLLAGDKGKALLELRKVLMKKHPLLVLAPLLTMSKQWVIMKMYANNTAEAAKKIGKKEGYVWANLKKLKNTSLKDLVAFRKKIIELEYKIKTGKIPANEGLEYAIIG